MNAPPLTDRGIDREIVFLACAISAGVHVGLIPEHAHESTALAASFAAGAVLAALVAVALRRRPGSVWPPLAACALFAGLIAAYALSRTAGLPVGEGEREPLDALGVVTKAIEVIGLIAAVRLTRQPRQPASPPLAERRLKEVRPR
jgi:peptidoglycan/LPS O-acetylase OafA/YrhL